VFASVNNLERVAKEFYFRGLDGPGALGSQFFVEFVLLFKLSFKIYAPSQISEYILHIKVFRCLFFFGSYLQAFSITFFPNVGLPFIGAM